MQIINDIIADYSSSAPAAPIKSYFAAFGSDDDQVVESGIPTPLNLWNGATQTVGADISYSGGVFTVSQPGSYFVYAGVRAKETVGPCTITISCSNGQTQSSTYALVPEQSIRCLVYGLFSADSNAVFSVQALQETNQPLILTAASIEKFCITKVR